MQNCFYSYYYISYNGSVNSAPTKWFTFYFLFTASLNVISPTKLLQTNYVNWQAYFEIQIDESHLKVTLNFLPNHPLTSRGNLTQSRRASHIPLHISGNRSIFDRPEETWRKRPIHPYPLPASQISAKSCRIPLFPPRSPTPARFPQIPGKLRSCGRSRPPRLMGGVSPAAPVLDGWGLSTYTSREKHNMGLNWKRVVITGSIVPGCTAKFLQYGITGGIKEYKLVIRNRTWHRTHLCCPNTENVGLKPEITVFPFSLLIFILPVVLFKNFIKYP